MTHRDIFEDEGCQLVFLKMRIVEIDLMYVLDKYFKTAYRIVVLVSGIKVVLTFLKLHLQSNISRMCSNPKYMRVAMIPAEKVGCMLWLRRSALLLLLHTHTLTLSTTNKIRNFSRHRIYLEK